MPVLERRIAVRGPRFWPTMDGQIMFERVLDASTREGPRPATSADREAHPEAFEAFVGAFERGEQDPPFKPLIEAVDPPGGAPPKEIGPHAKARAKAAE